MKYLLSEIAKIVGGELLGKDMEVESVVTDSRSFNLSDKTLFVAISGVNHDAHDYIESVQERGVRSFIIERYVTLPSDCGAVLVTSSIDALQALATHHRDNFRGCVAAITGSNGKTTIKEWIAQSLPAEAQLFRSPRSYNSQLGVALSLLMLDDKYKVALIEAGISEEGEMARLHKMIRPDIVIFSSIGDAHQQNFQSLEEKIDEKLILASTASDIIYHSAYRELAEVIEKRYDNRNLIDASFAASAPRGNTPECYNKQIVAAFIELLGYEVGDMSQLHPIAMRLELKQGIDSSIIVDDTYCADLTSLSIALDRLRSVASGRKTMLILSDILQSGESNESLYRSVAQMVEEAKIDKFIGIGKEIGEHRNLFDASSLIFESAEEAISNISKFDIKDCAILIKGNRASRLERLSHAMEARSHTTVLEVNLQAMVRNINYFRTQIGSDTKLAAMVKASSYGSGEVEIAQVLQQQGISYLAVAFADEGIALREGGITMPIVVLNADDASFDTMIQHNLEPEIYSLRSLATFIETARRMGVASYPIHLKIDSGMHRLGFERGDIEELKGMITAHSHLIRIASLFTHLCAADDEQQRAFTQQQIAEFDQISSAIMEILPYRPLRHAAATEAMLRYEEARFDMCRLGIGLYGFSSTAGEALEPIATLRTRIVQIRQRHEGDTIGYSRNGVVEGDRRIATIPIGYADGLNRHLGNGAWAMLVNGQQAKTIGNICMDSCMIDISGIEGVEEGDEVTIFSPMKGNSAADMARILDTIPYEVLTSISKRVKRIYTEE